MKKILLLFVLLLAALGAWAADPLSFVTDGYVNPDTATVGQDVVVTIGPVSSTLTLDWSQALKTGADTLAFTWNAAFSKAFGIFTPSVKMSGDQTFGLDALTANSGDWLSDLEPGLAVALGPFAIDLFSNMSLEQNYNFLQTVDISGAFKFKAGSLRAGFLYMDAQAVVDDIGRPFAPATHEGLSLYAKASISY